MRLMSLVSDYSPLSLGGRLGRILVVVFLLGLPEHAASQCSSSANAQDWSALGSVRFQAATSQIGCAGSRTVEVRAWISGLSSRCFAGEATGTGYCINHDHEGNANILMGSLAWGLREGGSHHWYTEGSELVELDRLSTLLYAGEPTPPSEECEAMGWVWDYEMQRCTPPPNCPIVMATDKNSKYTLTSAENGVWFDIDGDGDLDRVAWTEPGSDVAFLALDRDGDGYITSGKELFGNHTLPGSRNGFHALLQGAMGLNGGIATSSLSMAEPLFAQLLLWTDRNHNGVSEPIELRPVSEVFAEIGLGYEDHHRRDGHGNHFAYRGWASLRTEPGPNRLKSPNDSEARRRAIYDVVLVTKQ
jgi:hypothetical protein